MSRVSLRRGPGRHAIAPMSRQMAVIHYVHETPLILPITLFVLFGVVMTALMGDAASTDLLLSLLQTTMPLMIVGLGQTLVILTGGIDLAVGGIMSITTTLLATQMTRDEDMVVWIPLVLVVGFGAGILNGAVIVKSRIQPFIVTLASWSILSGIGLLVLPAPGGAISPSLVHVVFGQIAGIATEIWLVVGLLVTWLILRQTRFASGVYAVGSNRSAANLNGLSVNRTEALVYGLSGLCAAAAGIYFCALTNSGSSVAGDPYILRSVAAVVIGGTTLVGGRGGFTGTLLGALIMTMITKIVFFAGAESAFAQLFQGLLLVLAVVAFACVEILVERQSAREGRG
jgi:ribose transport system permease protein